MKKIVIFIWLFLGIAINSFTQNVIIKDKETNKPIELVTISSEKPNIYVITNAEGKADLSIFKGVEKIYFQILGYKKLIKNYAELPKYEEFVIYMETNNLNLDEVVISATKWRQTSSNVPSKIASISAKEIAFQNPQTAADLLGISGKVFIQKSQQGGGSPMIRGFATNRLIYTVDGVRMNTAIFRAGNIQNVINLDPFATEKTEVLFGPGSVIYGSDAIGGVMSFQTLTPQLSTNDKVLITGKALSRYSSANNEKTGHFDVNIGWKKWALVTSFSSWDYGHLRQGSKGPNDYIKSIYPQRQDSADVVISQDDPLLQIPTAYNQMNVMQKIRFKPNEEWDFQYGFHWSETSSYGRYDRHNRIRNGTLRYAQFDYGPQKWMMHNFNIRHNGFNKLYDQLEIRLAQQEFEESRIERALNKNNKTTQIEKVIASSANLDFTKKIGAKNNLFYGVEFVTNDVNSNGKEQDISNGVEILAASRYPNSTWNSMGVYVNNEFKLTEKFNLIGGMRYNHFQLNADFSNNLDFFPFPFTNANINNGALTGSLGTTYRPNEKWVIKANFGTAFRSPNVDDIGKIFDVVDSSVIVPNPNLKAEYAYNFDLGVAKVFGDFLKVEVTGYYTLLQNAMVRREFQFNGLDKIEYNGEMSQVLAIQNAAEAEVYGLQTSIEIKLPKGFSFSSDFNFQYGEEELDDGSKSPSRHAAPMFGTSRLIYNLSKLNLQLYAMYQIERKAEDMPEEEKGKPEIYAKDANGKNYSPGWYTLNLKAMYEITKHFEISAGIENLTDQRYRPYSSGLSGAGRNFILSIKASF